MLESQSELFELLQIERHHQERLTIVWNQFKDAWVIIQALELGLLGFAVAFPNLTLAAREVLAAIIVIAPLVIGLPMRAEAERRAAEIVADYAADFSTIAGHAPPRQLIGRAMKRTKLAGRSRPGIALTVDREE